VRPASVIADRARKLIHKSNFQTGSCTHCGSPATKELLFKEKDGIIIERYCDKCADVILAGKEFFKIKTSDL
jgi:hypothetical protein